MARQKICFVLPSLNGGGAERAAVHILNALDPLAWDRSMYLFRREGPYSMKLMAQLSWPPGMASRGSGGGSHYAVFCAACGPNSWCRS